MKRLVSISVCLIIFMLVTNVATGDSGVINPDFNISEPGQNAVIGWNETHEKLILSTHFTHEAEEKIQALRVIPFPSLPSVKESDDEVFKEVDKILDELMKSKRDKRDSIGIPKGASTGGVDTEWSTQIGSHNLTAYQVNSSKSFGEIVREKFEAHGTPGWDMNDSVEKVIKDYLQRGIRYFVIDIVDLKGKGGKAEPLLYEFRTDELYYPLLISSLSKEVGKIQLAVFSKKMIDSKEFKKSHLDLECYTWLTQKEVKDVSDKISCMFDKDKIAFTYFSYRGFHLKEYRDILTSSYKEYPRKPDKLPFIALLIFIGSSSTLVWYDLRDEESDNDEN